MLIRSSRSFDLWLMDLPPTQKGRHHEIRALGLREFAGLKYDHQRLDPFELAQYANLVVAPFEQVADALGDEFRDHLTGEGKNMWSGGAASIPLPNGQRLIILNPTHGKNRQNATLMEEISHVFLGHKPSSLSVRRTDEQGRTVAREYNRAVEEEAYSTGVAALVPYTALKRMVGEGKTVAEIARHFNVSRALVEFRIKISRLWDDYRNKVFSA